ncbi:Estradiol 17-beta-dehydrogenase 12 [Papilio machaon]|uniref:Estradiol 17-beta-dehydrogenase 12 n=1 Tax=Papilio machaon TaxID=76193 RepID=A0A194R1L7_PAPMA|nr:Estradiol 17-beta-dehydrogenase 12 [Papilio machaon]
MPKEYTFLEMCGIAFIASLILFVLNRIFQLIYLCYLGPPMKQVDFPSKGQWAVVTGCTDGIGKQYAHELASRGCDIVLISRSMEKLEMTADELAKYGVTTKIIQADFTEGDEIYNKIEKELADLEIGTLVNNVGVSYTYPEFFLEIPDRTWYRWSKWSYDIASEMAVTQINPISKKLASRGCDIILISRSMEKLEMTAEELGAKYGVTTKIIQADFTEGEEVYDKIEKEIADLEIGTLVNNVGVSYTYPEFFLEIPDRNKTVDNIIKANCLPVTRMTSIVMPGMKKRGKGVIVNIGSASSMIPSPLLTVYAASKAYVDKFTEGINMEYSKHGIIVQCVLPGFVCSNMSGIRRSSFFAPTAKQFVRSAIRLVGTTSRTNGYLPHALFVKTLNAIYSLTGPFAIWLVTRSMENSRRKALKKKGKLEVSNA